jgi:exosome complex exonuclease DIS3/RRP44
MLFPVLRERYLRDDIACGIIGLCDSPNPTLPARGDLSHPSFPDGHFLLPDTNVFLHQVCSLGCETLFMS